MQIFIELTSWLQVEISEQHFKIPNDAYYVCRKQSNGTIPYINSLQTNIKIDY
jgi:hypothetical protein